MKHYPLYFLEGKFSATQFPIVRSSSRKRSPWVAESFFGPPPEETEAQPDYRRVKDDVDDGSYESAILSRYANAPHEFEYISRTAEHRGDDQEYAGTARVYPSY